MAPSIMTTNEDGSKVNKCPACRGIVDKDATKCMFCGEALDNSTAVAVAVIMLFVAALSLYIVYGG